MTAFGILKSNLSQLIMVDTIAHSINIYVIKYITTKTIKLILLNKQNIYLVNLQNA